MARLGFTEGPVLEPGCGSGNFIAAAPAGAQLVGVELEPITAAVAAYLYPDAQILAESFAATRAPGGSFHLVVGNVPFAGALRDKDLTLPATIHNPSSSSRCSADPGGLVAILTSRHPRRGQPRRSPRDGPAADLLGAVRCPRTYQRAAGTRWSLTAGVPPQADTAADDTPTWE